MIKETGNVVEVIKSEDKELASICDCCGKTVSVYPESKKKDHVYDLCGVAIKTYNYECVFHVCEDCSNLFGHSSCIDIVKNGVNYETVKKRYENWKEHGFAKWCSWAWEEYVALPFWFLLGIATGVVSGILGYLCVSGGK